MIHPSAIIDASAQLADDVEVGPYVVIGADVEIGSGTKIESHVVISGPTKIGKDNHIYPFANIGAACQDKKYAGEATKLVIGDRNIIRENVTIHRGTVQDEGVTLIGNDNLLMVGCHVAHDCVLGDNIIMANLTTLGGHVKVADFAILGGGTLVHQFCQVGAHSMSGAGTVLFKDVPAYVTYQGNPGKPFTMNTEGLKRRGYSSERRNQLKRAFKVIYRQSLKLEAAVAELMAWDDPHEDITLLIESLRLSERGIIR
ncbi:acyl-ACP--UDP-N-acetylglucosamine O-acyltransferase [Salinibius halmophilus]|uniref:acyl-ACP--UDP-N-acetylglucosamine O-acyltransferase n=1 Tax=Salinibius halmophilus TaxID=1853216 RepID=UPI000E670B2F|nr:acyl-ACP--UDP-N-acetylglucosamine O-acyltransferase [Salinibius halmophilus]